MGIPAVNDLALDPSVRLNRQLKQLLTLIKRFVYNKNTVDNQKVAEILLAIKDSLKHVQASEADSEHCHRLLSKAFLLIQTAPHFVDPVTFLENKSSTNIVPIRSHSFDLADASFDRILEASDSLNPEYFNSHLDQCIETLLTEPNLLNTNNNTQKTKPRHLTMVASSEPFLGFHLGSKMKPGLDLKEGK